MTSGSPKSSDLSQEQFDIAPLSWVMTELREALSSAGKLLEESIGQDTEAQATSLLQAKTYLHQAHGALQIVEVEGVAIVTETVEELIERMQAGKLEASENSIVRITDAFHAVLRYLEDLLGGSSQQPVRLFPEYRALLELKGAERIHPADLFFPSLSVQEKIPELTLVANPAAVNFGTLRLRFEKLLLTVLTSKDAEAKKHASQQMGALICEIEQVQTTSTTKAFWLVMRAFAESTEQIEVKDERHIKQIWGRINLQIRRLVEGNSSVPERLLRDALFFIAQVRNPSAFVAQIRKAYQLENHVPENYDQKRYGLIPPQVLASAKELVSSVKNLWGRISNGDGAMVDKFLTKMRELSEIGNQLHSPHLSKLLRELNGIASHAVRAKDQERMGLELATCLLFVENSLDQITHLPANFAARADEISARLLAIVSGEAPATQATWIGEISREAQQRQTMGALVGEMQVSLKQAEKALDEHFREPSNTTVLEPVDGVLAQIGGAIAILDHDDALAAVNHTRELVQQFSQAGRSAKETEALYQNVAQNVGALSFFIETLQNQPEFARKRFRFDAEQGVFQTNLLEKAPEKELLPTTPLEANVALAPESTAEQDLIEQQKESERLIASLVETPDNSAIQAQLKDSLDHERSFAALLDDSEASARAKTAIDLLVNADIAHSPSALGGIVAATSHADATPEIHLSQELPETEEAIDAELLEIFLMEADEVLGAVRENIPLSRHEPANQEYLIRLRRSFHTLKGSGRMVGLNEFGEGAWHIEQVMNQWLSESSAGTEALYSLLDYAANEMFDWVEELKNKSYSSRNSAAIIAAALRVKEGHEFSLEPVAVALEAAPAEPANPSLAEVIAEPVSIAVPSDREGAEDLPVLDAVTVEQPETALELDAAVETLVEAPIGEPATLLTPEFGDADALQTSVDEEILAVPVLEEPVEDVIELMPAVDFSHETLPSISEHLATIIDDAVHIEGASVDSESNVGIDPNLELSPEPTSESIPELVVESSESNNLPDLGVDTLLTSEEFLASETIDAPELDQTVDTDETSVQEAVPTLVVDENSEPEVEQKTAQIIEFPDFSMPVTPNNDNTKRIGEIEISLPLHTIYMAETDEIVRFLAQDFAEWRHEATRPVSRHAVHASHSLAGSSATVGLYAAQELAHSLETVLQRMERHPVTLEPSEFDLLDHVVDCVKLMLQKFALSEMAERVPAENHQLELLLQAVIARSDAGEDEEFITSTNERVDPVLLDDEAGDIVEAVEAVEAQAALDPVEVASLDAPLEVTAALDEVQEVLVPEVVEAQVSSVEVTETMPADLAPVEPIAAPEETTEAQVEPAVAAAESDTTSDVVSSEPSLSVADEIDFDLLPIFLEEGNDLLPMVGQLLRSWQASPEDDAIPQSILRLMHTIKGSARMAGAMQLGQHTHDMETRIENLMHTGSTIRQPLIEDLVARHDFAMHLFERLQNPNLAALVQAAQVAPQELTVEQEINEFQDKVQFAVPEEVTAPIVPVMEEAVNTAVEVTPAIASAPETVASAESVTGEVPLVAEVDAPTPTAPAVAAPAVVPATPAAPRVIRQVAPQAAPITAPAQSSLVRVRADILDRLVNQAGEVSISRSKLENEVDTLKASLGELTENVSRLRDQLREVEIQAETQISSRMALSGDREFDPLEFDRFTRLQELTRMMAESVNDVASVQSALNRTIEGATIDLTAQARLTRELQQDLMRVRMIPFSSVSERLYRIARQTAKEMDKRVNLDIRGTSVEIDRGVLEKMVGPFEHMLRNAIVHGIETRQDRVARGKNEVGELLIEIRQEGNEVVIHFTDDGQGLHLARIRDKAKKVGLLTDESYMSESDVVNLIFEPGFSTASEVTELAGRGVGMDVVRSEAASLGGRVSVTSIEGQGAHFTIHLPLTLAVTQVVILSAGGKTFAVPSVLVEQVQQLKSAALAAAYNDGAIQWQGSRVALHYLPSMLGERNATPDTQQYTPILIMKSDNERVAIHVDQIIGNREVVVKNVGPQLARMIGIAGATVLGSGDIVLILNPVPLAQKIEHDRAKLPETSAETALPEMGAVAELVDKQSTPVAVEPVQGLRSHHIVMVVDDSLTVRRVTQRLLVREGFQVVLAKDGIDALEQLQSITPDVMLVDIEMPRMDGFDLTRNVRSDSRTNHIPIIMITSRTADKHRNYAMELGVNEYFGKPYREDDLLGAINGFVNKEASTVN